MHDLEPAEAGSRVVGNLNQFLRRLRQYRSEAEWISAVLDGASYFVQQGAIFTVEGAGLRLRGQFNLRMPESLEFPISSAAAFGAAIASKDPVVALRTASEVTDCLSQPGAGERALIVPILHGDRVVAALFAANRNEIDINALELVAGMAALVLERQSNLSLYAQIGTPSFASPLKVVS
ncbi:MAG: GAF domain-containing protein [Acidobacteriaceae bacterium]|nr:GAF domain-containing protein [Acidobacteriaceae bacterium]